MGSLLTGAGVVDDLLILRDYLLSVDMMQSLERDFNIREHYENESIDFVSRLNKKSKLEEFHKYYIKQIS
ncbi:chain-length determining protein, partial [Neptunomonas phycophila]|nr:chain-length determining protein [Neptunomonas phycophila]